ncbi:DUF4465 domain-containing protein [Isosphaeraceae bacterium EP7]
MNRMLLGSLVALALAVRPAAADSVVDFNDLTLAPDSAFNGPVPGGTTVDGPYGPVVVGSFQSGGASFGNAYDTTYGSWNGFAYSNVNDTTTPGFTNQFAAVTGTGHTPVAPGQVDNYGVAFGYRDIAASSSGNAAFDPSNAGQLRGLPTIGLPAGQGLAGLYVTNTTYAAKSMLNGDGFAKKFGGDSGNDADFFRLSAYGIDANGNALAAHVDFDLADFRFADNSMDYIVDDWRFMDLSALAGAVSVSFNLSSSDVGSYGMNTPAYFAFDDLVFRSSVAVPEPATLVMSAIAGLAIAPLALRRKAA